jgi:RecQ-mediated genome instability protein 1
MLVPEVIEILGGVVDELEAARVRLASEVNKPPRGKRYVLPFQLVNTSDFL